MLKKGIDPDKRNKDERRENARHQSAWNILVPVIDKWFRRSINFSCADFDPSGIEGPVIVMINHACAYDPLLVTAAFRKKRLSFVASEHLLRTKLGAVVDTIASIIPHRKGDNTTRTSLSMIRKIRSGESVFIAPEGEQTWNGVSGKVMPYTGRLIKKSGATLVTYRIEGAYLALPRWAEHPRKGKVYGYPVGVYSPEELNEMSADEVESVIARDLNFDVWEWQDSQPEGRISYKCFRGGIAEGLERAVCVCPSCGKIGNLETGGSEIRCGCGMKMRLADTGFFEKSDRFSTIHEWEKFDRDVIRQMITSSGKYGIALAGPGNDCELFMDEDVELYIIEKEHKDELIGTGRISLNLTDKGLVLKTPFTDFRYDELTGMDMVLSNRLLFSDGSGYYEIRAQKSGSGTKKSGFHNRTNLRKYLIALEEMTI